MLSENAFDFSVLETKISSTANVLYVVLVTL